MASAPDRGRKPPPAEVDNPGVSGPPSPQRHFGEAIASWQLAVQTEVKRTSTLPSGMFDACDPMLEARLCEAADAMFQHLLKQDAPAHTEHDQVPLALEAVQPAEIAALQRQFAGAEDLALPELDAEDADLLGILVDACCHSEAEVRGHAGRHLAQRFGVTADTDPLALAQELLQQLRAVVPAAGLERVQQTCQQIAAAVLQVCPLPGREEPLR